MYKYSDEDDDYDDDNYDDELQGWVPLKRSDFKWPFGRCSHLISSGKTTTFKLDNLGTIMTISFKVVNRKPLMFQSFEDDGESYIWEPVEYDGVLLARDDVIYRKI